ncbi:MAG: hypothetical protein ACP5G4_10360 [bacterium]
MLASDIPVETSAEETATTAADSPVGTFAAELPSASGMGRLIVLHIFENGNAIRTSIYVGEPKGDYIEEGTWTVKNGVLSLTLANTAEPPEEIELSFKVEQDGLRSVIYDESPMGNNEVFFTRIQESF